MRDTRTYTADDVYVPVGGTVQDETESGLSGGELSLFVEIVAIYSREMTRFEEKPFNRLSGRG
jgi:hypothetical protein